MNGQLPLGGERKLGVPDKPSTRARAELERVTASPPCLDCGACCFSTLETYARVSGSDHTRLAERAEALTVFVGNRCYMRLVDGHCAALFIDVASRRFVCSVYETRPTVCRELERSSPACEGEIHEKSERPSAHLHVLGQHDERRIGVRK